MSSRAPMPDTMRISVTDLDSWEFYKHGTKFDGSPFLTLDDYVLRLRRMEHPSPAAATGRLVHEFLETLGDTPHARFVSVKCDIALERPDAVEVPVTREWRVCGIPVVLSGRVDAIVGRTVVDYKTSRRAPDYEALSGAWQWRAYLAMLPECDRFRYDCFQVADAQAGRVESVEIRKRESFELPRHSGIESEVEGQLSSYVDFLRHLAASRDDVVLGRRGVVSALYEAEALHLHRPFDERVRWWRAARSLGEKFVGSLWKGDGFVWADCLCDCRTFEHDFDSAEVSIDPRFDDDCEAALVSFPDLSRSQVEDLVIPPGWRLSFGESECALESLPPIPEEMLEDVDRIRRDPDHPVVRSAV